MNKPNLECLIKEHAKEVERIEKIKAIAEFYKSLINDVRFAYKSDNNYGGY